MIALDRPTLVLQAALSSATGTTEPLVTVVSRTVSQQTKCTNEEYPSRVEFNVLTSTTPKTVSAAPAADSFKAIEYISCVNRSTDTETITFYLYDGTTRYEQIVQELTANQGLYYEEQNGWYVVGATSSSGGSSSFPFSLQLLENSPILIVENLTADGKYSGIAVPGTAGETIAFGEILYLKSDGKWWKADASVEATSAGLLGVCVLAGSGDAPTTVLLYGNVRADSLYPTLTKGAAVYLSLTAGQITHTQPASATDEVDRVIGFGWNEANSLFFNPEPSHQTHV